MINSPIKSDQVIRSALGHLGFPCEYDDEKRVFSASLDAGESDYALYVKDYPDETSLAVFAYLPGTFPNGDASAMAEYAGLANLDLFCGNFNIRLGNENTVYCVFWLDYEDADLGFEVVSRMIQTCLEQMHNHDAAFRLVASGRLLPQEAVNLDTDACMALLKSPLKVLPRNDSAVENMAKNEARAISGDVSKQPSAAATPNSCSSCGKQNNGGARFCIDCGVALVPDPKSIPISTGRNPCPDCGNGNSAGAHFCIKCGAPLKEGR